MDEEDHAFFDDDFDETGKSAPLKSSSTNETNGKSKPSLFQIHCDLHGSSNRLTTTEKEQQQQQHKSYNTDDSSDDSESSDDDLFTPKSSEKSLTKPYDKEDYERDISKRSNSPFVLSSSDSDDNDDDDDTLTDVSPRSSPEASPNMKRSFRYSFSEEDDENGQRRRRRAKKEFPVISSDEDEQQQQAVKHITKLNVTFKRDNEEKQQRFDEVTRGNTRKTKLQRNRKRHKGQGDALAIDHIEGSLSRYFEKDDSKTASSNRPKSSHHHHRTNPVRPLHMVDNNNQTTEVSDGYKTIDFEEPDGGGDSDKSTVDLNHLLEIILDLEEKGVNVKEKYKEQSSRRQESRQQKQRKNLSFSNDKAREIERENNRLFKEITKSSSSARSSRPGSSNSVRSRQSARSNASSRTSTTTMSSGRRSRTQQVTTAKPYHSAVNRVNLQRQIERENMQILKRLQDAKPTATLQRTNQLREYHRQTKYMASTASPPTSAGRHRRRYEELARDPDVIQQALDIGERRFRQIRPAWQDVW